MARIDDERVIERARRAAQISGFSETGVDPYHISNILEQVDRRFSPINRERIQTEVIRAAEVIAEI